MIVTIQIKFYVGTLLIGFQHFHFGFSITLVTKILNLDERTKKWLKEDKPITKDIPNYTLFPWKN
jgi:hypothetical protein